MSRRLLTWNNLAAIALVALCFGYWFVFGFQYPTQRANFGFGPDWKCTYAGKGDSICVKKSPN
jgi:hypothetical protein